MKKIFEIRIIQRIFWLLAIIAVWMIMYNMGFFPKSALPNIREVIMELKEGIVEGDLLLQTYTSIIIIVKGLILGFIIALILTYLSLKFKVIASLVDTITVMANPLPGVALLPLIIVWFGIGESAIIAIIIHSVVWPLIVNLTVGFNSIPKNYKEYSKNMELSTFVFVKDILLFSALPYLFSGLKIGWARAWRALISAEMIFGTIGTVGGLGVYIYKQRSFANTPGIFAGMIIIIVIGVVVEEVIFKVLEDLTIKKWGME